METILVTGAGGAAVTDLIKHLKNNYRVIAVDCDEHAAGLHFADEGYVVPRGDDYRFVGVMRRICETEKVQVVVPLVDEELIPSFDLGFPVLLPKKRFVSVCLDKMLSTINLNSYFPDNSPRWYNHVVVKPRFGHGSKGVSSFVCPDHVVQDYIDGDEYTVSVVVSGNNDVRAVVPKRIICKRGMTHQAVTERNAAIDNICRDLVRVYEPCGPFNVQCIVRDDTPFIFEINPRFSGTTNVTLAAGCDEVGGLIAEMLGEKVEWGEWQEGVKLVRHYHDHCEVVQCQS